jgi:hypothetical protein
MQVNSSRYHPAWGSLARDYLSIMAASVSSERAFSQGGITITKHRNRLKGDIVEALQCLKCAIREDLLFREPAPSSIVEMELDDDGEDLTDAVGPPSEEGWGNGAVERDDDTSDIGISLDSFSDYY